MLKKKKTRIKKCPGVKPVYGNWYQWYLIKRHFNIPYVFLSFFMQVIVFQRESILQNLALIKSSI